MRTSPGTPPSACLWIEELGNGRDRGMRLPSRFRRRGHPDPVKVKLRLAGPGGSPGSAWEATRRPVSLATWPLARCAGVRGGTQRPALPGPECSSPFQYPPEGPGRIHPLPRPPPRAAGLRARPRRSPANTVTTTQRMPFNREINENKDSRLCQASSPPC